MQLLLFNLSRNGAKCKTEKEKREDFSKMPLGKGVTRAGFKIGFIWRFVSLY